MAIFNFIDESGLTTVLQQLKKYIDGKANSEVTQSWGYNAALIMSQKATSEGVDERIGNINQVLDAINGDGVIAVTKGATTTNGDENMPRIAFKSMRLYKPQFQNMFNLFITIQIYGQLNYGDFFAVSRRSNRKRKKGLRDIARYFFTDQEVDDINAYNKMHGGSIKTINTESMYMLSGVSGFHYHQDYLVSEKAFDILTPIQSIQKGTYTRYFRISRHEYNNSVDITGRLNSNTESAEYNQNLKSDKPYVTLI